MINNKKTAEDLSDYSINIYHVVGALLAMAIMYWISTFNFLFFHSLAEIFSVVIAFSLFLIAWNARKYTTDNFLLFIGIGSLFIGFLDLVHTLAYSGMGVFPNYGANLPTQLWIAARYMQAFTFLLAILLVKNNSRPRVTFSVYFSITFLLLASMFVWKVFPDAYVDGVGLTVFKKVSEYIISFVFLIFGVLVFIKRQNFAPSIYRLIMFAAVTAILSEISFTFYFSVYAFVNVIGHLLKFLSFYALYLGLVRTSIQNPFRVIFRKLKTKSESLEDTNKKISLQLEKHKKREEEIKKLLK